MASKIPVRLHPLAEQEALAAFRWYEERNALVAKILLIEFEAAMDLIAESPPPALPAVTMRCRRGRDEQGRVTVC